MVQQPLPAEYTSLTDDEVSSRIEAAKAKLGKRAVVLGHHYQRDEIIKHADFTGDSYKLAKHAAAHPDAEFIVFCGVHFMAESADILTTLDQKVILPNLAAGCSMADMANRFQVKTAWKQMGQHLDLSEVIPITYINSAANIKEFVGRNGGAVCTSSNARGALEWALERGSRVMFFPDQHLGRNTAVDMGFDPDEDMVLWDPFKRMGGIDPEKLKKAKFILWKGHCSVHARFTVEQIEKARKDHPDVNVLVHPECTLDVVNASDLDGSTEFIKKTIEDAEPGSTWAIGTEINLVSRLGQEHPDKTVFCLDPQICPCATMYRIHPSFLLWTLEKLAEGEVVNQISVPEETAKWSKIALERMLEISADPKAKKA
jgi:quinolinate synthase